MAYRRTYLPKHSTPASDLMRSRAIRGTAITHCDGENIAVDAPMAAQERDALIARLREQRAQAIRDQLEALKAQSEGRDYLQRLAEKMKGGAE